jgi:hypothetical protein
VDNGKLFFKRRAEPPFGKAALQGHLSSFKTRLRSPAGSSILALGPLACRLAMAGPNPSAHTFPLFPCSLWWFQFSQYHPRSLSNHSITSNKWIT